LGVKLTAGTDTFVLTWLRKYVVSYDEKRMHLQQLINDSAKLIRPYVNAVTGFKAAPEVGQC
jgi:hypothetical protein